MKILIIGAGLGGLSAAIAFARQGHTVILFESRSTLSRAGGGINIRPGATRIMHTWILSRDLEKIGDPTGSFLLRNMKTGEIATRSVLVDASEVTDWGTTREVLMQVLYERAKEEGAVIRFGAGVEDVFDDGSKASLTLKNGEKYEADVILAADGIRSRIRYKILSDLNCSLDPIIGDTTLYGIRVDAKDVLGKPEMERLCVEKFACVWMGEGGFVVSRFNTTLQQFGGLFAMQSKTDQKGLWDENGDIEQVRAFFKDRSCEYLNAVLALATKCDRWKLGEFEVHVWISRSHAHVLPTAELPDLPRWTSKGGRIVLLGDSAHAMEPNAAQGFSMIIESIGVLEYLIAREGKNAAAQIPAITDTWQRFRKPRVERIKRYAKENGAVFSGKPPPSRSRLNSGGGKVRSLKDTVADGNSKFDSPGFLKWTLDYDAVAEVRPVPDGSH